MKSLSYIIKREFNRFKSFLLENKRFSVAIFTNIIAITFSVIWLFVSNLDKNFSFELEPLVTTLTLLAALFGLNFVNNKFTRPDLRLQLSVSIMHGTAKKAFSLKVSNHSLSTVYISGISIEVIIDDKPFNIPLLTDSFTRMPIKNHIESGNSLIGNFYKRAFMDDKVNLNDYKAILVRTELNQEFRLGTKALRETIDQVLSTEWAES